MKAVHGITAYNWARDKKAPDLGLSRPELNLYLFEDYGRVISGAGHVQFLFNSTQTTASYAFTGSPFPGDLAGRTQEALEEMGLKDLAEILREARSWLPKSISRVEDEREFARIMPSGALEAWAALDERYLDCDLAAYRLVHAYLRRHRAEILTAETA